MKEKKCIAIIPARGGSKRLPKKNILPFCGRPMLSWTVKAALDSNLFESVVVSTDDKEIAKVALEAGASVDMRADELATDLATVNEVCLELLKRKELENNHYEILCCLYATAPLRNTEDIIATVELVKSGSADFAIAVTHYDLPPFQALKYEEGSELFPMWPEMVNKRSSEVGELVVDNGSTYAARIKSFYKVVGFYGIPLRGYVMPRSRSIDIDEKLDLEMALHFARAIGFGDPCR